MLITGGRVAFDSSNTVTRDLWLEDGRVYFPRKPAKGAPVLSAEGYMILPGLINSHDHLELNLFPRLGHGPYSNARDWAEEIYRPKESPIKEHIRVPKGLRFRWGGLKNLLSGVTTVAHHNPSLPLLFESKFPVRVVERYGWAHSLHFSPDWRERFAATPAQAPFLIHAAEGTDARAQHEIHTLNEWRVLGPSTVLIHGVGLGYQEIEMVLRAESSLVWCPSSNWFTLGQTCSADILGSRIPIALGTDSALTANGDLVDELRLAQRTVGADRAYRMVTTDAARVLKLPPGFGEISDGGPADLLVFNDKGGTPAETLIDGLPQLVIVRGQIVLRSAEWNALEGGYPLLPQHFVRLEGRGGYLLSFPIARLIAATRPFLGEDFRLAGKKVAA